jgi:hypothetical protein
MKPYTEEILAENEVIRKFADDIDPIELMWHRDDEDRLVESISETDWYIQLENELPKRFAEPIFIPKHEWHRLIKGSGELVVKIKKGNNEESSKTIQRV